jgi:phosphoribosylaminoimidazole-succinocarboxamide synthase
MRNWVVARCDPYKDPIPEIPQEIVLQTAEVYIQAYETITGREFEIPEMDGTVLDRIRRNLAKYF